MPSYTPVTNHKVRFALVGCGRIAKNHLAALATHADDAELVDVCDTDPAALAAAVDQSGVTGHNSLDAMLATTTADAVIVATPSGLHPNHAIAIARSGRHVVSEKPMATRWSDGLRMVHECDKAGVRLFVVKQNRRNPTLQMLKRAVESGRFGRIHLVTLNVFWTRPQDYYDAAKWRGTWEFDGGALMNQASHYIDLLSWLVGPVESVQAYSATLERRIEAEDTAVASLRWRSGALGSLSVTMLTYPRNLEGSITILGEKGTARIGGVAVNEVQQWQFTEPHPDDEAIAEVSYQTTSVYGFGHPLYYRNVIDVLRGQAEPETDGRSGLKSLELLTAIYRSARDGVRVPLPLEREE
ncbi:UDP-N-acetyl-2-amino-2-deoxyglucuronate dehydrogenase [Sphingomonas jejuensis]|uniref:UDP-N-acetyl-2-amino-2-deoxyglucuronate dehydrogenase n=1 Tax=Sphingomonas jejuensis TaxID=904715 RepID=A0ABX0XLF3_9SPHN|nr:Gfo/Idh/MocA family oxidoreductase [Sphingomonas jejuensis]NJC34184.1 UDP-N-acetyl-2-amino-2-deoxyglucuronate dehydrogenase [Sphingomonas jejuensis]